MTAPACGSCGAPVADQARLCASCTRDLAEQLLRAASIASDLDDATARLLKRGSGGKSSSPEPPLPIDLAASNAASELRVELAVWAYEIRTNPSDTPRPDIRGLARWLASHLQLLRQHDRAGDAAADIRHAVDNALAVIDSRPERVAAGPCADCGAQLLAELDNDVAVCTCGTVAIGLLATRKARAQAADQIETATVISRTLERMGVKVAAGTIRMWRTRGRLTDRGERHGEPVYAMGDVIELCNERDERKREARGRRA